MVGGSPRTIGDLITRLSTLPARPTQVILSQIQCLIVNEKGDYFEKRMQQHHLSPQALQALKRFSASKNVKVRLFTDMPILLVQEIFRQHHDPTLPEAPPDQIIQPLIEAILIANDICNAITAAPTQDLSNPDNYATFALREILFNHSDQFKYMVGRSFLVYDGLKDRCRLEFPDDFFDVEDFYQAKLGISLRVYFHSIFAIFSIWCRQKFDHIDPRYNIIQPKQWLENAAARAQINPVLTRFTQAWVSPITVTAASTHDEIRSFLYELFDLRARPLLEIPEGNLCGNLNFIMRKYWDGPYYDVIASGTNREKDQFFRFLGRTLEMYVQGLLQAAFKMRFKKLVSSSGNPISDAIVDLKPNWRLVFEVKAKRPTRDMVSGTQAPAELRSVAQMAFEGLEQLDLRIQDMIADGFTGRITPILVTGGHFPINDFLWRHYFQRVGTLSFFQNKQVDWPQFMDVEALEAFTGLVGSASIADMMREKLSEDWKKESFQSFLFGYYLVSGQVQEVFNPVSNALYQDRMADLTATLFPESARKMPSNNSWRSHFKL
ncbi:MAG TPA: hypothetical protein PLZ57_02410 [Pseudobdellovibrionaceae bacterium]|nr:hypothetical protein [Pseudobdellovibrionaceae bacterium]